MPQHLIIQMQARTLFFAPFLFQCGNSTLILSILLQDRLPFHVCLHMYVCVCVKHNWKHSRWLKSLPNEKNGPFPPDFHMYSLAIGKGIGALAEIEFG